MKKLCLVILLLVLVAGCTTGMQRHREQIGTGLLTLGLNRNAFLQEWGLPERTYVTTSDEFTRIAAGWNNYGGSFGYFRGKVSLEVWEYQKREVKLVFQGLRLVGWDTPKTTQTLGK